LRAGFPSSGYGILYDQEKKEFIARVEALLADTTTVKK
jgi:hypothetical protein